MASEGCDEWPDDDREGTGSVGDEVADETMGDEIMDDEMVGVEAFRRTGRKGMMTCNVNTRLWKLCPSASVSKIGIEVSTGKAQVPNSICGATKGCT